MKRILLLLFVAYFFTGCFLQSVHPLVKDEDAALVDGLEGSWKEGDKVWTFINDPRNVPNYDYSKFDIGFDEADLDSVAKDLEDLTASSIYLVIYEDLDDEKETEPTLLLGKVINLNNRYFLDLSLFEIGSGGRSMVSYHQFPVHTFSRISILKDEMGIEFFKSDWIEDLIRENRVRIKHEKVDDKILVTAGTEELQKFIKKYSDDEDAFDDPINLVRTNESF